MKRNNDLIRDILLAVEKQPAEKQTFTLNATCFRHMFPDLTDETLDEHIRLLVEVGYLDAEPTQLYWIITRLTWKGHDFLLNSKVEPAWEQAKKSAGHLGFDIFVSALKAKILASIGV
jgi:hypothetical protein